jgi:hypothetical protein
MFCVKYYKPGDSAKLWSYLYNFKRKRELSQQQKKRKLYTELDHKIQNYNFVVSAILTVNIQKFKDSRRTLKSFQEFFLQISVENWFVAQTHSLFPKHICFGIRFM